MSQLELHPINLFVVIPAYISILLSICSLLLSYINHKKSEKNRKDNISLAADIRSINENNHWRKCNITSSLEKLYDSSCSYWTLPSTDASLQTISLKIKYILTEIEDDAAALKIDIIREIVTLKELITGGSFETSAKEVLSSTHEKFALIRSESSNINLKLS